jgi:hypothetical protein
MNRQSATATALRIQSQEIKKFFCEHCGAVHEKGNCLYALHLPTCICSLCEGETLEQWANRQNPFEEKQMLTVVRSNAPEGKAVSKGVQFLSPRHITSPEGLVFAISKVTTDKPDNYGNPYVVYFMRNGEKYAKGFKPTADALATLVDLFGIDEKKWTGKKVLVGVHTDEDSGVRLTWQKAV